DLEEPAPHLGRAVPLDPVPREALDELAPRGEVFRRGDVAPVVEDRLVPRRQRRRHHAELDERAHPDLEEKIRDLVGVEERVDGLAGVLDARAEVIVEEAVEADVPDAELVAAAAELGLPVRAERERGVAAPDGVIPDVRERRPGLAEVAVEGGHGGSGGRDLQDRTVRRNTGRVAASYPSELWPSSGGLGGGVDL